MIYQRPIHTLLSKMTKPILIFGATGKQGGSVITTILKDSSANIPLLAVTRDANSASSQRLASKSPNIKLIQGNAANPGPIFAAAEKAAGEPVWGVFSVQAAAGEAEEVQGKAIVDAAIESGVKYFVYSSVDRHGESSIDNPTKIPHFVTKHNIEHHLIDQTKTGKGSNMAWTILRPTAFMDNLSPDFFGKVFATSWKVALKDKPLQLIAVEDIGHFAGEAFLHPEEYTGKSISLAGDELTYEKFAEEFKEQTGKDLPLTFEFLSKIMLYFVKELGTMFTWFGEQGYAANVEELKKTHPELKDFKAWLEESKWEKKA
jgi:uncharacterized protein YbjT (DUF2867 family)